MIVIRSRISEFVFVYIVISDKLGTLSKPTYWIGYKELAKCVLARAYGGYMII